jgi:hypothetical protein
MVNINLVTDGKAREGIGSGISSLAILLLLVLGLYAFLVFYGKNLDSKTNSLKADYDSKRSGLVVGDSNKVLDFENRLVLSRKLMTEERNVKQGIEKVEEAIISGTYLSAYSYDDATRAITLECYTDNYETVAKQILGFKGSDYFSGVLAGETKFDTKINRIAFPVVLTIK